MGGAYQGVRVQAGEEVGGLQAVIKATEESIICIKRGRGHSKATPTR